VVSVAEANTAERKATASRPPRGNADVGPLCARLLIFLQLTFLSILTLVSPAS